MSFILDVCWGIFFNFLIYSVLYPSSDFLMCQILPEKTRVQDWEPDSPLNDSVGVEGGLVAVDTRTVDSPVQHTTDGKKIIHPFYPSTMIMN